MESQLQSLINKIKTDGVAEAEKEAQAVVTEAENKASRIAAEAKTKADEIVERAKQEAARTEEAGKKALEQAGRNLVLGLKKHHRALRYGDERGDQDCLDAGRSGDLARKDTWSMGAG